MPCKPRVVIEKRWFLWDRKFNGFVRTEADLPGWVGDFESEKALWDYATSQFMVGGVEFCSSFLATSVRCPVVSPEELRRKTVFGVRIVADPECPPHVLRLIGHHGGVECDLRTGIITDHQPDFGCTHFTPGGQG